MNTLLPAVTFAIASALPAAAQDFPQTFETKFGTATVAERPERVATVDFTGADDLLALGIQPVVIRDWYGDQPDGLWPWAAPMLASSPAVLRGELNLEQIAAADPDVIIALWSGIDDAVHAQLSQIAPVVAVPPGIGDFALPWDERALIAGRAIGREEQAQAQVDAIRSRLAEVAAAHPEWEGLSVAVGFVSEGAPGAYTSADIRPQLLSQLGFANAAGIDTVENSTGFSVRFSPEDLSPLDADLLIWIDAQGDFSPITDLPTRPFLDAASEGREVFMGRDLTAAFSHATLASLPFAIDAMIPMIEAALDGNPETHADDR